MYDWLIENAQILDGSGAPAFSGSVALAGGSVAAVGTLPGARAVHTLDAAGRTLSPGFLDIHRHADLALLRPEFGAAELHQGLTTVLNGNCGMAPAPLDGPFRKEIARYLAPVLGESPDCFPSLGAYLRRAEQTPLALHTGELAGMGVLRAAVAGFEAGPLSSGQLRALRALLERALGDGALASLWGWAMRRSASTPRRSCSGRWRRCGTPASCSPSICARRATA